MDHSVTFLGGFSKKLVTNTFFNLLGRSWSFLATLILTPYILAHLDVADFGTWILLSVFNGTLILFDLGLGLSFVKYISEFYTHKDYERINRVLFIGLIFYAVLGVVVVLAGLAIERPLLRWFPVGDISEPYLLVLFSAAVQNIAVMFMSVLKGIQRMDKSNSLEIKSSLINLVGTAIVLELGLGLFGLALNSLICSCIALILGWWTVRRVIPEVSLTWGLDAGLLREMLRYGSKIQISRLGSHICFQLDKPVISMFLGIGAVSFYEIGARLANFLRAVPLVMISALIPVTSELDARNERDRILQTYFVVSRYVAMVTIAVVAFAILEVRSLLTLWVGDGFSESVLVAQILVIGYGINILGGAASQTGAGIGRPEFDMRATLLLSIVNPILSITLVQWFGIAGAATGTSIALALSSMYLLATFQRNYVEQSLWTVVRGMHLKPLIAAVAAGTAVLGAHSLLPDLAAWANQVYLLPMKLAVDFWTFVPTYVIVLVALRQITAIDWKNFLGLISFGFEFIRHPLRERVNIYR